MDIESAQASFNKAIQSNSILEIIDLGEKLIREKHPIEDFSRSVYEQALSASGPYFRLGKAIQQNDDILIANIWRNNYEQLTPFVHPPQRERVSIALARFQRLTRLRRAFRTMNLEEITLAYDPVLFEGSQLFSSSEKEIYLEAIKSLQLLNEIHKAADENNEALLILLYPKNDPKLEKFIPIDVRRKLQEARQNINSNMMAQTSSERS